MEIINIFLNYILIIRKLYHNYMLTIFMAKYSSFSTFPHTRRFSLLSPAPLRHSPGYQCANFILLRLMKSQSPCICCIDYERPGIMKKGECRKQKQGYLTPESFTICSYAVKRVRGLSDTHKPSKGKRTHSLSPEARQFIFRIIHNYIHYF